MIEVTGKEVKDAIENGVAPSAAGRGPLPAGVRPDVRGRRQAAARHARHVGDGRRQAARSRRAYTVATNDFMLGGGDGYTALGRGKTLIGLTDGKLMANEVMVYLRRLGTVDAKVEGRVVLK